MIRYSADFSIRLPGKNCRRLDLPQSRVASIPVSCYLSWEGGILACQLATADTVGRDHTQDEENTPKDAKRQERDHD